MQYLTEKPHSHILLFLSLLLFFFFTSVERGTAQKQSTKKNFHRVKNEFVPTYFLDEWLLKNGKKEIVVDPDTVSTPVKSSLKKWIEEYLKSEDIPDNIISFTTFYRPKKDRSNFVWTKYKLSDGTRLGIYQSKSTIIIFIRPTFRIEGELNLSKIEGYVTAILSNRINRFTTISESTKWKWYHISDKLYRGTMFEEDKFSSVWWRGMHVETDGQLLAIYLSKTVVIQPSGLQIHPRPPEKPWFSWERTMRCCR